MGRPGRRQAVVRGHGTNHNARYAGRKRPKPDTTDDDSSDGDSSSEEGSDEDSEFETASTQRNSRNANSRYSQHSNLNTQPSQQSKRRKLTYPRGRSHEKWRQNQSNVQRRSTRLKYRKLADDTIEHRAAIVDPMTNKFMDKLEEQNKIYDEVCHPNEAFMDIEQAKNMTNILKEQTRTLANEQFTITPQDFIKKVAAKYRTSQSDDFSPVTVDWARIGARNAQWFFTVPPIQFMNGPLQQCEQVVAQKKKPRQVRQKKTFTTSAPVVQPKKVLKQKKRDKTETKSRVTHLTKILRTQCEQNKKGVNPFQFLINPYSYSQTIENLFDTSFLMKEGCAQMNVDKNSNQPILSFVTASERTRRHNHSKQKGITNGQCIVKFNPSTFCTLIDAYGITESQIERADADHDPEEDTVGGGGEEEDDGGDADEDTVSEPYDDQKSAESESEDEEDDAERGRRRRGRYGNRRGNDKEEAD